MAGEQGIAKHIGAPLGAPMLDFEARIPDARWDKSILGATYLFRRKARRPAAPTNPDPNKRSVPGSGTGATGA